MQETQETWVWSLSQKDHLEYEVATTPVFLSWKFNGQSLVGYHHHGVKKSWRQPSHWAHAFVVIQSLIDFLRPRGLHHARLSCPSLSPRVFSNSCPLSQWCCLTISPSATLFSFCLQFFPASGSFSMSQFFTWGGQSIGASASVLPMNIQGWLPLGLTGLISLLSKGLSRLSRI